MLPYQHWDEVMKGWFRESFKDAELACNDQTSYFRARYGLWLDFRTSEDQTIHGSGRRIENASEGITLQLDKTVQTAGALYCYIFLLTDAQMNIGGGQLISAIF
jgi:hypothetical protein